jgi:hypothetical protein
MRRGLWTAAFAAGVLMTAGAQAAEPAPEEPKPEAAKPEAVDQDHLTVHRIDVVDDKGVVRLMIAAPTPDPVIGGKAYHRAFPVSGIVLFDDKGGERGGFGVADVPGSAPVLALDHDNMDAIGWKVLPDGSVTFQMNQRPPEEKDAAGKIVPARRSVTPVLLRVAPDGTPALTLTDKQERPRVRLTVTAEGFGALEFLDASGKVVETYAPERRKKRRR